MQIVQATFGVFHQFELAHQLLRQGHLKKIYSTWPWQRLKREGIPREYVGTFPWVQTPDYLMGRTRFYPKPIALQMKRLISTTFDQYMLRAVPECDALIALAGGCLLTGPLVQRRGGKFICDRGSTHHRFQDEIIAEEHARWGLPRPEESPESIERDEAIYAVADAITVPSSFSARTYVQYGIPASKLRVVPYGVRLERFKKVDDPPTDSFEVLFAGQVSLRKGIPYLLEAFARLKHPKKRLTVVGAIQDSIRPLLDKLPVENVTFLGSVPQAELVDWMSRSHVMVLPSIEEGLALVQAQAMACECPVIATYATGAEDLFTDQVEGFIVAERDVDALVERMQQIADDPALRERMAAASRLRVQSIGGWNTYGRRWDEVLHELTGIPRGAEEEQ
jgi:glycosyltransferase involved in cell wall biosynthesis